MNTKILRNAVAVLTAFRLGVAQEERDVCDALEVAMERATPRKIETALVIWHHNRIHRLKEIRLRQEGWI